MRKYPPVPALIRSTSKDYKIEGTKLLLKAGTKIFIPALAFHHDPDIYRDPDVFDPERFSPEETAKRHPYAFMAFGDGPRNCIGKRFGMVQAKLGMASLLKNLRFTLSEKVELPLTFRSDSFVLATKQPLWLKVKRIS